MQAVPVDLAGRNHAHDHLLGAAHDGAEQLFALPLRALLRVVQERERPDAVVAQALVIEEHARDDERSGEWPPARFVGACDQPRAELPVEPEELLAGTTRHAGEHSARPGGA